MTLRSITLGSGHHGLEVSALGYGAMSLAGAYGSITEAEASDILSHVADRGVNFLDTANIYGDGESERLVGRFLKNRREEFVLATKVGIEKGAGVGKRRARGDAAYIKEQIDESLTRLGTDHVDLYYLHRVDPETPIEESVGALSDLVSAGKVRRIGLSEATAQEIRRAHAVHPITAVQSEWSIFARDVEEHVLPVCATLGIGFVPYSPVGRGLLTDRFDPALAEHDARRSFPWFASENLAHNHSLAAQVREAAERMQLPTAGLALAWLTRHASALGVSISPIPGTRFGSHWDELQRGLEELELTAEVAAQLDGLAAQVQGDRSFDPAWVSGGREGLIPR